MPYTREEFERAFPGILLPVGKEEAYCTAAEDWATARVDGRAVRNPAKLQAAKAAYILYQLHLTGEFKKADQAGLTVTVEGEGTVRRETSSFSQHAKQSESYLSQAEKLVEEAVTAPSRPRIPFAGVAR